MLKDDPLIGKIFDFLARTGHNIPIPVLFLALVAGLSNSSPEVSGKDAISAADTTDGSVNKSKPQLQREKEGWYEM